MIALFLIAVWNIEVVDSGGYDVTSIEINQNNFPEIAYGTDFGSNIFLHYAFYDGSNWNTYIVDSVVGGVISLKRKSDSVYIAYTDGTYLLLAGSQNGDIWTKENTNFRPDENDGIKLDIDSIGPKIVYHCYPGAGNYIFYVRKEGGIWLQDTVHRYSPGDAAGFSLDRQGIPHVSFYSYSSPYGFTYATKPANTWIKELVAGSGSGVIGAISSVAIDDSGKVFLLYRREIPNRLLFAEKISGNWVSETVKDTAHAGTEGLAVFQNRIFCAFYRIVDTVSATLYFAERVQPNQWSIEVVDTEGPATEPSLAIDIDAVGNPHISYVDINGRVKHATRITGIEERAKISHRTNIKTSCVIDVLGREVNSQILNTGIYFFVRGSEVNKIVILCKTSRKEIEEKMRMGRMLFR